VSTCERDDGCGEACDSGLSHDGTDFVVGKSVAVVVILRSRVLIAVAFTGCIVATPIAAQIMNEDNAISMGEGIVDTSPADFRTRG
jgi:hypothetical protein